LLRPLARPRFRRLCGGRVLSSLADWLLLATLVGWLYARAGSGAAAALLLTRLAPPLVGGGLAAAVVDRLPRRPVLVGAETVRLGAALVALAGVSSGRPLLVLCAAAAGGLVAPVGSIAVRSSVPLLVPQAELPAANGVLGFGQEAAMAVGALGAGAVLATAPAAAGLSAALVASATAAVLYVRLGSIATRSRAVAPRGSSTLAAGLRHLRARPVVLLAVAAFAAATLATGLTNATLPALLGTELGLGSGGYGLGLGSLAVGLAVGQALGGLLPLERAHVRACATALAAMALPLACLALAPSAPVALLLLGLVGVADGASEVVFHTIAQRECDPWFLGRVLGVAATAMTTTMTGAVALAPLVARVAPPRIAVAVAGLALGVVAVVALLVSGAIGRRPTAVAAPAA
jgi:hypothetical protein